MLASIVIIFLFALIIYKFPYLSIIGIGLFLIYPFIKSRFHSSNNFISHLKNYLINYFIDYDNPININELELLKKFKNSNPTQTELYDVLDNNWTNYQEKMEKQQIKRLFMLLPEIEIYQNWLYSQQELYYDYQLEIKDIWEKILNKLVLITIDTGNYANHNFQDFLELQQKLLDKIEFIQSQSISTNPTFGINAFANEMISKNRLLNSTISKWINKNIKEEPLTTRSGYSINDFIVNDWVAPFNLLNSDLQMVKQI